MPSRPIDPRANRPAELEVYRMIHGAVDGGPPHCALDRYGRHAVAWVPTDTPSLVSWARSASRGAASLVIKDRSKHSSRIDFGEVPKIVVVREGPVAFEVQLDSGYQTGLFIDGRPVRERLDHVHGDVLNLFGYTATASVRAARAGCSTTTVDASRRALAWGRRNMEASGIDPDAHRWFSDDVMTHLARTPDRSYDVVVCDPPAFGRAKKRRFELEQQLEDLIAACARISRSSVLFSCHSPGAAPRVRSALRASGCEVQTIPRGFDVPLGGPDWGAYLTLLEGRVC